MSGLPSRNVGYAQATCSADRMWWLKAHGRAGQQADLGDDGPVEPSSVASGTRRPLAHAATARDSWISPPSTVRPAELLRKDGHPINRLLLGRGQVERSVRP